MGSIPGMGRSPGRGNGNSLQCSCQENPLDKGGWRGPWGHKDLDTTKQLSTHTPLLILSLTISEPPSLVYFSSSAFNITAHISGFLAGSSCLQCRRPGFDPWDGKIPWRRKWQPTPVHLPGKSHGRRSLVGYSPWGRKESDTTEQLHFHCTYFLCVSAHHLSSIPEYIHLRAGVFICLNLQYLVKCLTT